MAQQLGTRPAGEGGCEKHGRGAGPGPGGKGLPVAEDARHHDPPWALGGLPAHRGGCAQQYLSGERPLSVSQNIGPPVVLCDPLKDHKRLELFDNVASSSL